jgi:hypothetical protein
MVSGPSSHGCAQPGMALGVKGGWRRGQGGACNRRNGGDTSTRQFCWCLALVWLSRAGLILPCGRRQLEGGWVARHVRHERHEFVRGLFRRSVRPCVRRCLARCRMVSGCCTAGFLLVGSSAREGALVGFQAIWWDGTHRIQDCSKKSGGDERTYTRTPVSSDLGRRDGAGLCRAGSGCLLEREPGGP